MKPNEYEYQKPNEKDSQLVKYYTLKNIDQFNDLIANNKLVFIEIYANWCYNSCKNFDELIGKYPDIVFAKSNVDEMNDIVHNIKITAIPVFMFFHNGEKIDEVIGADLPNITKKIKKIFMKYSKQYDYYAYMNPITGMSVGPPLSQKK